MHLLNDRERAIYNEGERLIPGRTHDLSELVRHRSAYVFWREIISDDLKHRRVNDDISVLDLGCGVGHGCYTLSQLPNVTIVGVDKSAESIAYANEHYPHPRIEFIHADIQAYIPTMPEYDYVVSRNVFEHLEDGLSLLSRVRFRQRFALDVPYDEAEGNLHHRAHHLRAADFEAHLPRPEFFYQALNGDWFTRDWFNSNLRTNDANVIMCVASRDGLPPVHDLGWRFPWSLWGADSPLELGEIARTLMLAEARQRDMIQHSYERSGAIQQLSETAQWLEAQIADLRADDVRLTELLNVLEKSVVQIIEGHQDLIRQQEQLFKLVDGIMQRLNLSQDQDTP